MDECDCSVPSNRRYVDLLSDLLADERARERLECGAPLGVDPLKEPLEARWLANFQRIYVALSHLDAPAAGRDR